ncbi:17677_t:CDS:2 [Racocetra fulgida]|uniref:17677_t:CDS:1 n=1 Tax=Racocetra fulgida TaxID=60492 RepID=A0A9N9GDP6_9GLOM|nr:17677_t:CDS:2 [Racocetra fulgida]
MAINNDNNNIEIKEENLYNTHDDFVDAVRSYAKKCCFQRCLGKVEKNIARNIRKSTVVCSCEGDPKKTSTGANIRNRLLQRCNCQFLVHALLNSQNNLYHTIILENHQHFIPNEREIPLEVQEKIILLHRAGCNITTIHAILREEFINANNFTKILEELKSEDENFQYKIKVDPKTNELQQVI